MNTDLPTAIQLRISAENLISVEFTAHITIRTMVVRDKDTSELSLTRPITAEVESVELADAFNDVGGDGAVPWDDLSHLEDDVLTELENRL